MTLRGKETGLPFFFRQVSTPSLLCPFFFFLSFFSFKKIYISSFSLRAGLSSKSYLQTSGSRERWLTNFSLGLEKMGLADLASSPPACLWNTFKLVPTSPLPFRSFMFLDFPSPQHSTLPDRITFLQGAPLWLTASILTGRRWSSTATFHTIQSF